MIRAIPLALALACLAGTADAQPKDDKAVPKSPPTLLPLPPEQGEGSGSSMSERLSESEGVIAPPREVDPQMKHPAPPAGPNAMPVIPPPGSPGGDQTIQPK
jgi:hypothetical protein